MYSNFVLMFCVRMWNVFEITMFKLTCSFFFRFLLYIPSLFQAKACKSYSNEALPLSSHYSLLLYDIEDFSECMF